MIPYQKIDVSEGIDINKASASKEFELCYYWFLKDIAILNAKETTFRYILMGISKNEGLKRLSNSVTYDRGVL